MEDLEWNALLVRNLGRCRHQGLFCDATLQAGDGEEYRVHACVLASASPTLQKMLLQCDKTPRVIPTSIPSRVLRQLIACIYGEDIQLEKQDLPLAVHSATQLGLVFASFGDVGVVQTACHQATSMSKKRHTRSPSGHTELETKVAPPGLREREYSSKLSVGTRATVLKAGTAYSNSGQKRCRKSAPLKRLTIDTSGEQLLENQAKSIKLEKPPDSEGEDGEQLWENQATPIKLEKTCDSEREDGEQVWETQPTPIKLEKPSDLEGEDGGPQLLLPSLKIKQEVYEDDDASACPSASTPEVACNWTAHTNTPNTATGTAEKNYCCALCGASFVSKSTLEVHETVHKDGDKEFKCPLCPLSFRMNSSLASHVRTHTNDKSYPCRYCGQIFQRQCGLSMHERKCEPPYDCDNCGKQFMSGESLRQHEKTHVLPNTIHTCHICGWVSARKYLLKIHVDTHRSQPYKCEFCKATFQRQRDLNNHRKFHLRGRNTH